MHLIIGNKTYSSWSMRPWILMKHFGIPFRETLVKLDLPTTSAEIRQFSPSGRVPALVDGALTVWDSLAIMEFLNEKFREHRMWPGDEHARAEARAAACEMHSGFSAMRQHLSFHAKKRITVDLEPAAADIARIKEIWSGALKKYRGPFLYGPYFTIADAMFAPVCGRFRTYGVPVEGELAEYVERILALPAVREWYDGAAAEDFIAPLHE